MRVRSLVCVSMLPSRNTSTFSLCTLHLPPLPLRLSRLASLLTEKGAEDVVAWKSHVVAAFQCLEDTMRTVNNTTHKPLQIDKKDFE